MAGKVKVSVVPAPTSGLNLKDNLVQLQPTEATVMKNVYPDDGYCRLIGPYREAYYDSDTPLSILGATRTTRALIPLIQSTGYGNKMFLIYSNGALLYDVNTGGLTDVTGTLSTIATIYSASWEYFGQSLFFVTNNEAPRASAAGAAFATPAFTYTGTDTRGVFAYRNRLYLRFGRNIQYGAVDAVAGAMTKYDLELVFKTPGQITGAGSTTKLTANVDQELLVVVNRDGEVLIYQGDYPGSTTWGIVDRFFVGRTESNCTFYIGADLHILSSQGITPVAALLSNQKINEEYLTVSDKIAPVFKEHYESFSTAAMGRKMRAFYCQSKQMIITGLQKKDTTTASYAWDYSRFFIMNNSSKAWCELVWPDGHPGRSKTDDIAYAEVQGRLFLFVAESGTGDLWEFDILSTTPEAYTQEDFETFTPEIKTAHTYLDDPVNMKSIKQVRALLSAKQLDPAAVSPTNLDFNWKVGTIRDFFSRVSMSSVRFTAGHEEEIHNGNWAGLADMGRAISFYYGDILPQAGGEWNQPLLLKLFALEVQFETGSVM